jgi:hypothetical protein
VLLLLSLLVLTALLLLRLALKEFKFLRPGLKGFTLRF